MTMHENSSQVQLQIIQIR